MYKHCLQQFFIQMYLYAIADVYITYVFRSFPCLELWTLSFYSFIPDLLLSFFSPTFVNFILASFLEILMDLQKKVFLAQQLDIIKKGHLDDALRLSDASETGLVGAWDVWRREGFGVGLRGGNGWLLGWWIWNSLFNCFFPLPSGKLT